MEITLDAHTIALWLMILEFALSGLAAIVLGLKGAERKPHRFGPASVFVGFMYLIVVIVYFMTG